MAEIMTPHPDLDQLSAFSLGKVDDEAASVIEAHLETCADCRHMLETVPGDSLENLVRSADPAATSVECSNVTDTLSVADSSPSSETPEPIPEWLEYFRIEKVLGQGGMGTVYLADDTRLQRKVALKTLKSELAKKPGAKDRFLREARAAARLQDDHIVPIHYVGEADGIPFLAMPFLPGESLESRIKGKKPAESKPLPIAEAIHIARQVAQGLAVAHAQGLIHRDIKPANIWLEAPTGRVKILDFGLARSQAESGNLTATGAIMGTPAYMAPEQARGKSIDARADLFSLF